MAIMGKNRVAGRWAGGQSAARDPCPRKSRAMPAAATSASAAGQPALPLPPPVEPVRDGPPLDPLSPQGRAMASAIAYLADHAEDQPDLAAVAARSGLSPSHFQRQFTRWAGISPKRFCQILTAEAARDR